MVSSHTSLEAACYIFPVDEIVEEVCQIVGTLVAEVDIVGMFPYITAQQGGLAKAERVDPVFCLLYTSPSPRDATLSRMPSSA